MVEKETCCHNLKFSRWPLVVIGGAIVTIAIIADRIGFGQPGSFGTGQLVLLVVGLFIGLIGLFGKRTVDLYRDTAVILLNTLILLALLELGSIIVARLGFFPSETQVTLNSYPQLPYYSAQDWTETFWGEATVAENYRYEPYTVWRHQPFDGTTVVINQDGMRRTPGTDCTANAYKVFTFGGSTMWGWGAPDWGTIAAYLQKGLEDRTAGPVCVINFGEDGFVSTQSLIELIKQLQAGNVPEIVIFYDGVNDVYAAYESGQPGAHATLANIAAKFEEPEHPLVKWIKSSRQFSLFERVVDELKPDGLPTDQNFKNYKDLGVNTDPLANAVIETYLSNYKIVGTLAREYGFEYFFFWQPHLAIDEKSLTKEEEAMRLTMDQELVNLVQAVYEQVNRSAPDYENLWYIAKVFEGEDEQIWIDTWGHVTPEGNRLIAQEMLTIIKKDAMAEK